MRLFTIFTLYCGICLAQTPAARLIYVGDPMCSWCYGFTPEIDTIAKRFSGKLSIEMVMGGLNTEQDLPLDTEMKASLKQHWEEINLSTGMPFNYKILNKKGLVYNTEPACRAVVTYRTFDSTNSYRYFKLLQKSFYENNIDITQAAQAAMVAKTLGVDSAKFHTAFISNLIVEKTKNDFLRTERNGIEGFPCLLLLINDKAHVIANGYTNAAKIEKALRKFIK